MGCKCHSLFTRVSKDRGDLMQLLAYMEAVGLAQKSEAERAKMLCYYHHKEEGLDAFKMSNIASWMEECSFSKPNTSRLKTNLTKGSGKQFLISKADKSSIEFVPAVLQALEREYGKLWQDTVTIESNNELFEEVKFCGKRPFLDSLIRQINFCYGHNCYDACAVLMRRMFEVLLVLTYQNKAAEPDISNSDGTHKMLESIVKDAKQNPKLGIPRRISNNFDAFRNVGNYSAHAITYTAGKLDIDSISQEYRVMMEDLYNRAGLI